MNLITLKHLNKTELKLYLLFSNKKEKEIYFTLSDAIENGIPKASYFRSLNSLQEKGIIEKINTNIYYFFPLDKEE